MSATIKQFHSSYDYRDIFTIGKSDTIAIKDDVLNVPGYQFANGLLILTAGNISFIPVVSKSSGTPVSVDMVGVPVGTVIRGDIYQVKLTGSTSNVAALIR